MSDEPALEHHVMADMAKRIAQLERERDAAREYLSAAADDYDKLLAFLEKSYRETDQPLPFEEAFADAARECRETSLFLREAGRGDDVSHIYNNELSKLKSRAEAAEARLAEAREVIKPFAFEAEEWSEVANGAYVFRDGLLIDGNTSLKVGHLRAARDWLEKNRT